MNKKDLIEVMATKMDMTKKDTEVALNAITEAITEALMNKENVQIIGFGTFAVKERAAREGRNPRKPEEKVLIPASTAPVFKAGKGLKDAVNK